MKFPKNKANLYLVVREEGNIVCGGFSQLEDADNYKEECEQEWFDKLGVVVPFRVTLTTFYG